MCATHPQSPLSDAQLAGLLHIWGDAAGKHAWTNLTLLERPYTFPSLVYLITRLYPPFHSLAGTMTSVATDLPELTLPSGEVSVTAS